MTERVPDLLLEKLALGELSDAERTAVQARLDREPDGAQRLEALARDDTRALKSYPPGPTVAAISRAVAAAGRRQRRRRFFVIAVTASAAAAALLLVAFVPLARHAAPPTTRDGVGTAGIRLKGDPLLLVYRKGSERSARLESGASVRRGDRLQLVYVAAWARHGVIFSIDGNGSLTRHFPSTAGGSTRLRSGKPHQLASSFELDDAPDFERVVFVASRVPLDVEKILAAARRLGRGSRESRRSARLPAPSGALVKNVLLVKAPAVRDGATR